MEGIKECPLYVKALMTNHQADIQNKDSLSILAIVINVILAIAATLGNGMVIVTILGSQNLQTPSYLLITSLAFTDFLVGLVFHPLFLMLSSYIFQNNFTGICDLANGILFISFFLGGLSFAMVTCISIDRYLALTLRHRYTIIVTKKRVRLLIAVVWIFSFSPSLLTTWDKLYLPVFMLGSVTSLFLLVIICFCYIKSFRALHLYTVQIHAQQPNALAGNFNVVRYKKTLKTMLLVLACFLLCFLPAICPLAVMSFGGFSSVNPSVLFLPVCFVGLSSSINPVIYLVRFADIRNACREMLRNLVNLNIVNNS